MLSPLTDFSRARLRNTFAKNPRKEDSAKCAGGEEQVRAEAETSEKKAHRAVGGAGDDGAHCETQQREGEEAECPVS